ncbi:acyltransferase [Catenovulum sp. SM1970]|uniref:acyltransferase family protein n=1 Tax=Marinifaba aquimaris TaxID=2741323 RepID=UPI001572FEA0|nr:acyltransferase [Marinifaba aquimaris]NTS78277.1 acyltransferase [Marinifaba aquimaris]
MTNRVVQLDILRAIAILSVFLAHTVLSYGAPSVIAPLQFGGTGVDLFFVLSGWLIGSQLFSELNKFGNIEIRRFWVRRWMRTLPAYYAVLIFTIIQLSLTKDSFEFPFHYFFFTQNYDLPLTFFHVSWSLCVEEQFYLVIAPAIVLLAKVNRHTRTAILLLILLLPSVFRYLGWYDSNEQTHVRWDCCIMGIILAHLKHSYQSFWQFLIKHAWKFALLSLVIYFYFYLARWNREIYLAEPSKLILAFVFGAWVIWANSFKEDWHFKGEAIVMYISTRSYAIYLLHPDALAVCKRLIKDAPFVVYLAVAFAISCLVAECLYRLIELPGMKARSKFSFSQSRKKTDFNMQQESKVASS